MISEWSVPETYSDYWLPPPRATLFERTYNRTELEATKNFDSERIAVEQGERLQTVSIAEHVH